MEKLIRNFIHKIAFALAAAFAGSVILTGTVVFMAIVLAIFKPEDLQRFYRGYLHIMSLF